MREQATALLHAFARSELTVIDRLCSDDVVVFGTDERERWAGKRQLLESFAGAYDLAVAWVGTPRVGEGWLAGDAEFVLPDGARQPVRVTMVFRDGLLAHAHYSIACEAAS